MLRKIERKMYLATVPHKQRVRSHRGSDGRIIPGTWRQWRAQGGVAKFLDQIKAANAAKNRKGAEQK